MNPTGLLLIVVGVFIVSRTLFTNSNGETLAGMLAGGQASSLTGPSSSGPALGGLVTSTSTGLAPNTHSSTWASDLLRAIGAPVNQANLSGIDTWIAHEGNVPSIDMFNPLDTTQPAYGAVSTNSAGVKSYLTWAQGVNATAKTLLSGKYNNLVQGLRAGQGINITNPSIASEISTWGTTPW